jgi:hypothetical protein
MLREARTAGSVKLHRGEGPLVQWQVWAVSTLSTKVRDAVAGCSDHEPSECATSDFHEVSTVPHNEIALPGICIDLSS